MDNVGNASLQGVPVPRWQRGTGTPWRLAFPRLFIRY